jgi:hypothetical protein
MTSAELKALVADAHYLEHRDVLFAHILVGMVVALENIREELINPGAAYEADRYRRLTEGRDH